MKPEDVKFQFRVLKKIKYPFQRQISEAISIRLRTKPEDVTLLNNKQEFSRCVLPEIEVTMKDKIVSQNLSKEVSADIDKKTWRKSLRS